MLTDSDGVLDSSHAGVEDRALGSARPALADVVYTPAHPDRGVVRFETRRLPTGEAVGVAFRSRSALIEALGSAQPWMALPLSRLEGILGAAGIGRVLIDPTVDESAAWWTPERLSALTERLDAGHG